MYRVLISIFCLCNGPFVTAQINEHFDDGDFTSSPVWTGSVSDWQINTAGQLQSESSVANSSFFLVTANNLAIGTQWEFNVRLAFNTSSANYVDVFLILSHPDPTSTSAFGYFVRIGNTQDEVSLYRKDANGAITKIIDGTDGVTNTTNNDLHILVVRNSGGQFRLFRVNGPGAMITEGEATDLTYNISSYFGILVRQSTSSFFQKHYVDDIVVKPFIPDTSPPVLQKATPISTNRLSLQFNEPIAAVSASLASHYSVTGLGSPLTAQMDNVDSRKVLLQFAAPFPQSVLTVSVSGIEDLWGNVLQNGTAVFQYQLPARNDVVISEIFPDPSPPVGLPEVEYIEIKNRTAGPIQLGGWQLIVDSNASTLPAFELDPDSALVLTSVQGAALFSGAVLPLQPFHSLLNDGARLTLISSDGVTIHSVCYDKSWYRNSLKKEGGWSLEMIDISKPCTGAVNWMASINPTGGTPGKPNSVAGTIEDSEPPKILYAFCIDSIHVLVKFSRSMDSVSASFTSKFSINANLITSASCLPPDFSSCMITIGTPLLKGVIYQMMVRPIADCYGKESKPQLVKLALAQEVSEKDLVINEILFDPPSSGYDYIEIFNNSQKTIDASAIYLANRTAGILGSPKKISTVRRPFFPGDYMVITEDLQALLRNYMVLEPDQVLVKTGLPSFPNTGGTVVIHDSQGRIIDEVQYSEKWHFPLLNKREGVSLERIFAGDSSNKASNWHSAAASAGFGTPTYKNSQSMPDVTLSSELKCNPERISPDGDGFEDWTRIDLRLPKPGFVATCIVFDVSGRPLRYLARNELVGEQASWKWDGLGEQFRPLPSGWYIIRVDLFNLEGTKLSFKKAIPLLRKH